MAKAKADMGEKRPSQKVMVQTALTDLGDAAKPQEMQSHIKSKFGVDLPPNIISNYKSQIKRSSGLGGSGRGGVQIEDLATIRGLVSRLGAEQVKMLVDVLA